MNDWLNDVPGVPSVGVALRESCVWRAPSQAVAPLLPNAMASRSPISVERSSRLVCGTTMSGAGGTTSVPSTLPVPAKLKASAWKRFLTTVRCTPRLSSCASAPVATAPCSVTSSVPLRRDSFSLRKS